MHLSASAARPWALGSLELRSQTGGYELSDVAREPNLGFLE